MNLRPMIMADADFMLELKNYPETRKFAIASHDEIKKEDHYKWLEKNLQYFQVIQVFGSDRAGAVRIQDNEISIWIAKEYRKCKIATGVIIMLKQFRMKAKIVVGNIPSIRAFINAGFRPIELIDNAYYIFQSL